MVSTALEVFANTGFSNNIVSKSLYANFPLLSKQK